MEIEYLEYAIRGKDFMFKKMLVSVALAPWLILIFLVGFGGILDLVVVPLYIIGALPILVALNNVNYYFFYRIDIYKDGFYVKTNPFNGKFYYYNEVTSARIDFKDILNKSGRVTGTKCFLRFVNSQGKRRKVYFDDTYCINEIRLIIERVKH